jgi:glucose/arabinose dehydrogenase
VHGVALGSDSSLYVSTATSVLHYRFGADLAPNPRYDTLITGLPQRRPQSHSLAIDPRNNLIVNIGAASEGCQPTPTPNTPGRDPCPELDSTGGLWSFRTDQTMQGLRNGVRIATGLHNAVALTVNPRDTSVYAVSHGRDMLHEFWPALYSDLDWATAAAEEMIRVASMRADYGWPYCYYSYFANQRVVAPEYGGDKHQTTRCGRQIQPLTVFPAHWAPMAMLFYTGTAFPPAYRTGVFVAFHGSALRAPLPQEGYVVAYVAFKDGLPAGETQIFANGFAGGMMSPEGAEHRPTGLAQDAAGALYVSDDKGGRIWKITWRGAGKD